MIEPLTDEPIDLQTLPECRGLTLVVTNGSDAQHRHTLPLGRTVVGSSRRCSVCLPAAGVQPVHCLINVDDLGATVTRWAPGVRLNGNEFATAPIRPDDVLALGGFQLRLETGGAAPAGSRPGQSAATRNAPRAFASTPGPKPPAIVTHAQRTPAEPAADDAGLRAELDRLAAETDSLRGQLDASQGELTAWAEKCAEMEEALQKSQAGLQQAEAQSAGHDEELGQLNETVHQLQEELRTERDTFEEGRHEIERLRAELQQQQEHSQQLWQKASELGEENRRLVGTVRDHERQSGTVLAERDALRNKLDELTAQASEPELGSPDLEELDVLQRRVSELEQEAVERDKLVDELGEQLSEAQAATHEADQRLEALKELEADSQAMQSRAEAAEQRLAEAEKELGERDVRWNELQETTGLLQMELEELRSGEQSDPEEAAQRIAEAEKTLGERDDRIGELEETIDRLEKELERLRSGAESESEEVEQKLTEARQVLVKRDARCAELEAANSRLQQELEELRSRVEADSGESAQRLKEAEEALRQRDDRYGELEEANNQLQQDIEKLRSGVEAESEQTADRLVEAEEALRQRDSRCGELEESNRRLEQELEEARTSIEALRAVQLSAVDTEQEPPQQAATPESASEEPALAAQPEEQPSEQSEAPPTGQAQEEPSGTVSFIERYRHMLEDDEGSGPNAEPEPQAPPVVAPQHEVASAEDESEEALQSYMENLMRRVRGEPSSDGPPPVLRPATPGDEADVLSQVDAAAARLVEPETQPEDPQLETPESLDEPSGKATRPVVPVDLNAMRELANTSARRAIVQHAKKSKRESWTHDGSCRWCAWRPEQGCC